MRKYLMEFIGTFFLVFAIAFTDNALAIGFTLVALVYLGRNISGAHYNPAVTLSAWLLKRISNKDLLIYWIVQIGAAFLAALCFTIMYGVNRRFIPAPDLSLNVCKPLFIETVFTFLLVLVSLQVVLAKSSAGNQYYGFAVGFTVLGGIYACDEISGAIFNPAVGAGPLLLDALSGGTNVRHLWLYILGPCLGGSAAAFVFKYFESDETESL